MTALKSRATAYLCEAVLHWIDSSVVPVHPNLVELLVRRTAVLVVVLALGAAGWAECAGWQATPEARMACCSGDNDCPMHGSAEPGGGSKRRVVTQAQADSCCAASETQDSTPSAGVFSLSLATALVPSTLSTLARITAPASFDAWRTHVPLRIGQASKHVLFSVFLI